MPFPAPLQSASAPTITEARTKPRPVPGIARLLGRLFTRLRGIAALRRQRLHLSRLDPRLCEDIGLSHAEAQDEAARPFWDAPDHWLDDRRPPF